MPTFGKWEQTVLEKTYENVNFVSCHAYYQPFFKEDGTRDMGQLPGLPAWIWTASSRTWPPPSTPPRPI